MLAISTRVRHVIMVAASLVLLGSCENNSNFVAALPAPTLASISPDHAAITSLLTIVPVTLSGTNFGPGATVTVSGSGVLVPTTIVISSTIINATFLIDGTTTLGPRDVTVLMPNGRSEPRTFRITADNFVDLGLVIRDTRTGLFWEKKTPAGTGGLHDVSNTFTWCQAIGDATPSTPCAGNTESWVTQVNAQKFAGYSDWRIPTAGELQSILLAPCPISPACVDPIFSPLNATGSGAAPYWSSSETTLLDALTVNLQNGATVRLSKSSQELVRAVR